MLDRFTPTAAQFEQTSAPFRIAPGAVQPGLTQFDGVTTYLHGDRLRIFDRVCDHNGGRLISKGGKMVCPLHGWEMDPKTGQYTNVACTKQPLLETEQFDPGQEIVLDLPQTKRRLMGFDSPLPVSIRYLNHACLIVEGGGMRFATDPWLIGPAFSNGWWLAEPSPSDAIEAVNACDFLFISHNHPDHLHPETLAQIRRDMPVLTAAFPSRSTERYLRDLGFETILAAGFDERLVWEGHEVALSVLKSGDFRDDSGLMVEIGSFSAVLSVDANYIDFWRFPEGLSLLASSFAGGASGFPLCFDTFDDTAKARIVTRNRNALLGTNGQMLSKAKPKVFAPYAGFFSERAPRDARIKAGNGKNSVASYARLTAEHGATLVDLTQTQSLTFEGGHFTGAHALTTEQLPQPDPAVYIAATQATFDTFDPEDLARYFQASGFEGPLDLRVSLTDESFEQTDFALDIRFRKGVTPEVTLDTQNLPLPKGEQVNMLHIKGRRAEVVRVIRLGLPWEDLSIGFQCRIDRVPNVYNSDFWFHFTNVYVNDLVQRESLACDACHRISHALASA